MKIRVLDQIHLSSVQADSLRPGQEFEVTDVIGAELLAAHPQVLQEVAAGVKSEPAPKNKAEFRPANKSAPKGEE